MRRFTRKGDIVLDPFLGSGTTLIECRHLGRSGIGVELVPRVANLARSRIAQMGVLDGKAFTEVVEGDSTLESTAAAVRQQLAELGKSSVQLVILHPPYHNIIRFSSDPADLSNAHSVDDFLGRFGLVVDNFLDLLDPMRYLAVVIGDEYVDSEWVPLGFLTMNEVLKRGELTLKSIVVKNMVNNRAKRNLENLWRYRALAGGFYVFRHEYILVFQKKRRG